MRHLVFQVKENEIEPCRYLKCPADGRYEKAEQSDVEIQRFLLWAHKAGLLKVWGSRRFALEPNAAHKVLAPKYPAFLSAVQALSAVTPEAFERDDRLLDNLQIDLKHAVAEPQAYYISLEKQAPIPFERFLRVAKPEQTYYIGGVVLTFRD